MGGRGNLWATVRHQHSAFSKAQALVHLTPKELRTLLDRGDVIAKRRGVYAVAGAIESYEQAVMIALLAAGFPSWASHRTAARLYDLRVPPPESIDVLTLPNRRLRLDGVQQHRNQVIVMRDTSTVHRIPATTAAKTLVDCIPWLPGRRLGKAVDDARRRELLTHEEFEAAHANLDHGRRTGRHLVVPGRPVVASRHHAGGSERELEVLTILAAAGVPLPVQQFRIFIAGRWRFLDYAYPEQRIYLEFDGFAEHGLIRGVFDDDRDRDAELALAGWLGLHFTSNTRPRDVVDRVVRALAARAA